MSRRRVLLVGWDAADWKVARPLMGLGQMPHLARLVAGGSSGNLATIYPPLSPMLWTSIATGKRPPKHGVHGFAEPLPDGSGVRPVTTLGRKTRAVWNILNLNGVRPSVVGWWPSYPAEPVRGVMVSNSYTQAGTQRTPRPLPPDAVHPADWYERLAELRVVPTDLPGEVLQLFVPEYQKVDQAADQRLHALAKIVAETMTTHAAATEVLEHAGWDFAAVYYDAIDHFSHAFMSYHPPRTGRVSDDDFALYRHVVGAAYRYHDVMLGRLLQLAGPETTVIVMSDHGFHADALRPGYIPAEAAGAAVEHRHFGMFTACGPGIKAGEAVYGASVLDVTPTLLHLFGLPVGRDMDGKVLVTLFEKPGAVEAIDSWDAVEGDAGTHPPDARVDPVASAESMNQLVALGYVAPPGGDAARAVREAVVELRYNLARAHDDAGEPSASRPIYESLLAEDPDDHRFAERLVYALLETGDRREARAVLDAFDARYAEAAPAAAVELARRRQATPDEGLRPALRPADLREQHERRVLAERAGGFVGLRRLLRLRVDLADERFDEVRADLAAVESFFAGERAPRPPAVFLASVHARLRDDDVALAWADRALEADPEDWEALALAARLHLRNRRYARATDAAASSLALIYFQPITHYVLGRALLARGEEADAEREFRVAVAQGPGLVPAHESLARLYEKQPGRQADAARHRNLVAELRRKHRGHHKPGPVPAAAAAPDTAAPLPERPGSGPADAGREIVVVAGLPRSGTSMLMQVLAAGGVAPLTDGLRGADADNPRGYLEFEPATRLGRGDHAWLAQARGKALKLALPLVTSLPPGEHYRLIVIERDVAEVIASQRAMLRRLGRSGSGARLDDAALAAEYARHRERLRAWLDRRPEVAVLPLNYADVLADPGATARRLAGFLGRPFDADAALQAVAPSLRRQRAGSPPAST